MKKILCVLRQHRTITSADLNGSFAPVLQFQKRKIHTVFQRFRNFELAQNLSLSFLAELCGVALTTKQQSDDKMRSAKGKIPFLDFLSFFAYNTLDLLWQA